ncbi:alpha/beta hydrolase [Streptomyces kaniharaensis]|uniref:Alpha/beta hydrolase n=1 Tax=Streptomyces kaniharaensis TaxID=212423 RepID=A0A6N7KVG8_9ACTN|nr:alpha/beta hydrolase [Streptomyces kaniharaensis]MQS14825.1 alpha/beta hydrolase [Streptomyces kaniharaensis]
MNYGPHNPDATYVEHGYPEETFDTGEVTLNYATTGPADKPALLLIPAQGESWWGYEAAMKLLEDDFEVFAVDLRGQGRSTRTPGRYTLDNMGNDLVRFVSGRVRRSVVACGLSSGGVIAAWLSAYAPPGMLRGAYYEDAPLFSSEIQPPYGHGMHQAIGPWFTLISKYLGDQWSIGDWRGLKEAMARELPPVLAKGLAQMGAFMDGDEPPQTWKEYDPEWARAFATGSASASCDHARMLASVKVPVMFSHHFWKVDEESGRLQGAVSDLQVRHMRELITKAGQRFDYQSFPKAGHVMHQSDPQTYVAVLRDWISTLDA